TNSVAKLVHVRLLDQSNGERLAAKVEMLSESGQSLATNNTRAGTADLNDMPDFTLPAAAKAVFFRFTINGQTRESIIQCASCAASHTLDFAWSELAQVESPILETESWLRHPPSERGPVPDVTFSRQDASRAITLAWDD